MRTALVSNLLSSSEETDRIMTLNQIKGQTTRNTVIVKHCTYNSQTYGLFLFSPFNLPFQVRGMHAVISRIYIILPNMYAKCYLYNQKLIHNELSVNEFYFIVNLQHKYIFEVL